VRGKDRKERRALLSNEARKALKDYLAARPESGDGALFLSRDAQCRMTSRSVQHMVSRAAQIAGLERRVTPHTLRHTLPEGCRRWWRGCDSDRWMEFLAMTGQRALRDDDEDRVRQDAGLEHVQEAGDGGGRFAAAGGAFEESLAILAQFYESKLTMGKNK
jgi:integrase